MKLAERVNRDAENARKVREDASGKLAHARVHSVRTNTAEPGSSQMERERYSISNLASLRAIQEDAFQAMVELVAEVPNGRNSSQENNCLWYANARVTVNEVLENNQLPVLSWTHPGIQLGLTRELNQFHDVRVQGYLLLGVKPLARAKFTTVSPAVAGLYEPGGRVGEISHELAVSGLKAVKLDMTSEQVDAFVGRMKGLLIVTGAPGSGKTTVAFQRIRFLFEQQNLRTGSNLVVFAPELTRIFLANTNLVDYTRHLLVEELGIAKSVLEHVPKFMRSYLARVWKEKLGARVRSRKSSPLEERARQAFFGLCSHTDLKRCWQFYEAQIAERLRDVSLAKWRALIPQRSSEAVKLADKFANSLKDAAKVGPSNEPLRSRFRMDEVFKQVREPYQRLRGGLPSKLRKRFDQTFARWIFGVYDPIDTLAAYFHTRLTDIATNIRRGTGNRVDEQIVIEGVEKDWKNRVYGQEQEAWIAWLLRFALPEEPDPRIRFREMPGALPTQDSSGADRWTHIVVDEAQDLSAPEASLISSLVHPEGAFTISADFKQVVSPVHGLTSIESFKFGCSLRDRSDSQLYPFARNMRQSREIGSFLQGFYQAAFGESASFQVSDRVAGERPRVILCSREEFATKIRQLLNALKLASNITSIALLQIDEDEREMKQVRDSLRRESVALGEIWKPSAPQGHLITSSVERVKGLEYDVCIVLGLDTVDRSRLNFSMNRAYVALSRPCLRLAILCEDYPGVLKKVDGSLFVRV
jgi:hypothetical protein